MQLSLHEPSYPPVITYVIAAVYFTDKPETPPS